MPGDTNKELIIKQSENIANKVDEYFTGLTGYLDSLGLPKQNVLVPVSERRKVIVNLPDILDLLNPTTKGNSFYISKFIAACGAGLFDAALNFVWDETIKSLRNKVAMFDLEYFYNSVVTDPEFRKKFRTAEDLEKLEDWDLIRGCRLTGILSDIGYRHLDYIRNMRNWASAAHPNQNELTGLQVLSWLETCIKEVIGKEPSAPAMAVRIFLQNIRDHELNPGDIGQIIACIESLPTDLSISLLRTIFGMYVDPQIATRTKNNIKLISSVVWSRAPIETRQEIGIKYSTYSANADIPRHDTAKEFLVMVNGLSYLPVDSLSVELSEKIANLFDAHMGFNNFHNEYSHAKALSVYIPDNGIIPEAVRSSYVKTITMCTIGNGYGVSNMAYPIYEALIAKFQDQELWVFVNLVCDREFSSRLQFNDCSKRYHQLVTQFVAKTHNQKIIDTLSYLVKCTVEQLPNIGKSTEMKRLLNIVK